jgi:hypothetical protein
MYKRLLEAAKEVARHNRNRLLWLRWRFDLPEDIIKEPDEGETAGQETSAPEADE